MKYTVLTLFPEITDAYFATSIMAKAIQRGIIEYRAINIRDFALDKHKTCDDAPYGGGPGMLMLPEPLIRALEAAGVRKEGRNFTTEDTEFHGGERGGGNKKADGRYRVIYLSPSGRPFNQALAQELARERELVLLCGRYEGIDQRVIDRYIDDEVSVGDYVLSSGEIAALALIDATYRLVDRVITPESLDEESFSGGLLEYPQYTRPEIFDTMKVPDVLLSGHHENIRRWRLEKRIEKTLRCRPDLIRQGRELGLFNEEINGIIDRIIGDSEHERD
jgi:tRNA (guanine37-N1)-methyltransferase